MADLRALLVDIDGVLVVSWEPIPGAVEAFAALREDGVPMRFLTNTTSKTRADIADALRAAGFGVHDDEVLTVAAAADSYLAEHHPGARCLLLNSGDVATDLPSLHLVPTDASPAEVDVVLLGGAGPEFTYEAMNRAFRALMAGATLVAMHCNVLWRTADGLQLDAGAYVAALEHAAGVEATVIGKPDPGMFEAGLAAMGAEAREAAMIGDDLDSDVRGAQAAGLVGVQVRTGKFRPEQLDDGGPAPDAVLDSFAAVPAWFDV